MKFAKQLLMCLILLLGGCNMFFNKNYPELLSNAEDEDFVDMKFKIENLKETGDEYHFNLKSKYNNEIIGMKVKINKNMTNSLDKDSNLIKRNVYRQGVKFYRSGSESDKLISIINELYGFGKKNLKMTDSETFTAIVLSNNPINLKSDEAKIKIFGKDDEQYTEDDYYESFFNIDIKNGFVWWNEKDSDYRKPLIKSMSKE